ncbi:FK506-binding protein 15-like isoform X2 [Periplaneta americana]
MQNWSIMFENNEDAVEFAKEIGLARSNSAGEQSDHNFITQDLLFGVGFGACEGDSVEIRYIVYPLSAGKIGQEIENTTKEEKPLRVKLKKDSWEEGLFGMAKGCKRMIILEQALAVPWKSKLPSDSGAVLEVDVGRIKSSSKVQEGAASHTDSGESAIDSSTDDTSIKARGASISEALTNSPRTHKASIISRMARMGQATLPLKGAIACNPSDSEETEEELGGDSAPDVVNKAPLKIRLSKSRPAAAGATAVAAGNVPQEKTVQSMTVPTSLTSGILPQQMAVYQPISVPWQQQQSQLQGQHQFLRSNGSLTYVQPPEQLYPLMTPQAVGTHQVYPLPSATVGTSPAVSSPESHLSVFLAETRTQNSEVRMNVAKVADKVDQVLTKLNSMQQLQLRPSLSTALGTLEPATLLASIQKIIAENEQLRVELEEKRTKIDEQNEKMYQLLDSNQKYLEKSSSMLEQRNNCSLQALILTLQQEKIKLSADLNDALSRSTLLEMQMVKADKTGQGLNEEVTALSSQLKLQQTELERTLLIVQDQEQKLQGCSKSLLELQAIKDKLERNLHETEQQLQQEKTNSEHYRNELVQSLEAEIAEMRRKELSSTNTEKQEQEWKLKLKDLKTKYLGMVQNLEQENTELKEELKNMQARLEETTTTSATPSVLTEVKKVMNLVYHTLQPQFTPETLYDGSKIRQMLMATIREVTLKYIEVKSEKSELPSDAASSQGQTKSPDTDIQKTVPQENSSQIPINQPMAVRSSSSETGSVGVQHLSKESKESSKEDVPSSERGLESQKDESSNKSILISEQESKSEEAFVEKPIVKEEKKENSQKPAFHVAQNSELPKSSAEQNLEEEKNDRMKSQQLDNKEIKKQKERVSILEGQSTDRTTEELPSDLRDISASGADKSDVIQEDNLQSCGNKEKQSREPSLERSWRPQPPPPPLFDEDDEDDDWLS